MSVFLTTLSDPHRPSKPTKRQISSRKTVKWSLFLTTGFSHIENFWLSFFLFLVLSFFSLLLVERLATLSCNLFYTSNR